jgi:hypothetical protein
MGLTCKSKDRRQTKDYYGDADEELLMSARSQPCDRITKQARLVELAFVIKNCYTEWSLQLTLIPCAIPLVPFTARLLALTNTSQHQNQ